MSSLEYFVSSNSAAISLLARRNRKRRKVDPVNEDVLRLLLGKINRVLSSSPSFLSMLPSCCTSSTSISSSSCDILLSAFRAEHLCQQLLPERKQKIERRENEKNTCRIGAERIAKRSAQSLAMLLGEISPKISTTTVTTTVEIVAPASP